MSRLHGSPAEIAEQIESLDACRTRVAAVQAQLTAEQLATSSLDKGRTPVEILAHLRACADLWSYSIYAILSAKEEPILAQLNAHKWSAALDYANLTFDASFNTFKATRAELLHVLHNLPTDTWSKTAMIGERQHSIYSQARRMALHEISHCKELESIAEMLRADSH